MNTTFKYWLSVALVLVSAGLLSGQERTQKGADPQRLVNAWRQYKSDATNQNAEALLSLLPPKVYYTVDQLFPMYHIIADSLKPLENLIAQGDSSALRIAFRLISISDGAFTEELCSDIGEAINANPTCFLIVLQENYSVAQLLLPSILATYPVYTENDSLNNYWRNERIKSIQTVGVPELQDLKRDCLKCLNEN